MKKLLYCLVLIASSLAVMFGISCDGGWFSDPNEGDCSLVQSNAKNRQPILKSPEDQAILIGPQQVTLKWWAKTELTSVEHYRLYLDSLEFSIWDNPEYENTTDTMYVTDILKEGIYFWTVILVTEKYECGYIGGGELRSFTILPLVDSIKLRGPNDGAYDVALEDSLKWELISLTGSADYQYDIFLDTNDPPTTIVGSDISELFFKPTLDIRTTYYWKVFGKRENEDNIESETWSFTTLNNPPTKAILTAPPNEATDVPVDVALEWQASSDPDGDAFTYNVLLMEADNPPVTVVASEITELTFSPALEPGTTYIWQISCTDEYGARSESEQWSFTTLNSPPTQPILITPGNGATDVALDVAFQWLASTDPDGDAVTYNVLLMEAGNPPATVVASEITEISFSPTLESGTTYIWQVSSTDEHGARTESEQWSFTTINNPPTAAVLTSPVDGATDVAPDVTLEWQTSTDPDDDEVRYDVLLDTNNPPTYVAVSGLDEELLSPILSHSTTYYWQVVSKDKHGSATVSEIWNFTTANEATGEVVLLQPVDGASDVSLSTELTWGLSFDPGGVVYEYDLYLDTSSPPSAMVGTHITQGSFWPTLSSGTTYYWKVVGTDYSSGNTVESAVWNFTTQTESQPGSITDSRDGQVYETETIGEQIWMARNLAYLPALSDSIKVYGYEGTDKNEAVATENYQNYGALYSWQTAMNGAPESSDDPSGVQGICPTGWHLPSVKEWNELRYFIEGEGYSATGTVLKATTGWLDSGNGTDVYGFKGQASGQYYNEQFTQLGYYGYWWTTVQYSDDEGVPIVWYRSLSYTSDFIRTGSVNTSRALWSVRCLKD